MNNYTNKSHRRFPVLVQLRGREVEVAGSEGRDELSRTKIE